MGLMQSGSNFTDRIVKYVAKRAERKTKPASPPRGHVIISLKWTIEIKCNLTNFIKINKLVTCYGKCCITLLLCWAFVLYGLACLLFNKN